MNVLLLGSYNGQDSLGDKCLLRCVVERVRRIFGEKTRIITHVHNAAELQGPLRDIDIEARQGVQSYLWRWQSKLGIFTKNPLALQKSAENQFAKIGRLVMASRPGGRLALQDLDDADAIIIYGGTNFSRQWWWLNTPAYILSCRWAKATVFLAPQQYGPMESDQLTRLKEKLLPLVESILCRNHRDVELLGLGTKSNVLVRDEVFSNTYVYPVSDNAKCPLTERDLTLLVNMRFSSDFLFDADDDTFDCFCHYVGEISRHLKLQIKLFCMSGWSFADDLAGRKAFEERLNGGERFDVLAYTDEFDLIREATKARACISMSFHGAILSMIGGCPSVPVTKGVYYDYKYIGFSGYNPSNPIPLISLAEEVSDDVVASLIAYFVGFQPDSVWLERERSNESINNAYSHIANIVRSNKSQF